MYVNPEVERSVAWIWASFSSLKLSDFERETSNNILGLGFWKGIDVRNI
jgi:hypothetical protein